MVMLMLMTMTMLMISKKANDEQAPWVCSNRPGRMERARTLTETTRNKSQPLFLFLRVGLNTSEILSFFVNSGWLLLPLWMVRCKSEATAMSARFRIKKTAKERFRIKKAAIVSPNLATSHQSDSNWDLGTIAGINGASPEQMTLAQSFYNIKSVRVKRGKKLLFQLSTCDPQFGRLQ